MQNAGKYNRKSCSKVFSKQKCYNKKTAYHVWKQLTVSTGRKRYPRDIHKKRQATQHGCLPILLGDGGKRNWNSVRWGKIILFWAGMTTPTNQRPITNGESTPSICPLWVSIYLSFNSQQEPSLSILSGYPNQHLASAAVVLVQNTRIPWWHKPGEAGGCPLPQQGPLLQEHGPKAVPHCVHLDRGHCVHCGCIRVLSFRNMDRRLSPKYTWCKGHCVHCGCMQHPLLQEHGAKAVTHSIHLL